MFAWMRQKLAPRFPGLPFRRSDEKLVEVAILRHSTSLRDETNTPDDPCRSEPEISKTDSTVTFQLDCGSSVLKLNFHQLKNSDDFQKTIELHTDPHIVKNLQVTKTLIKSIPIGIGVFHNLLVLNLSDNYIETISWSIVYLKKLEYLDLSNNFLKSLPPLIGYLSSLKTLLLTNNDIKILPTSLLRLVKLEKMDVTENNLLSPPLRVCLQGKETVFRALRGRLERSNMWSSSTPWYKIDETDLQPRSRAVKDLMEICVNCIMECEVDFLSPRYVPPVLKNYLVEKEKIVRAEIYVAKCSECTKYFSNEYFFENHACN